MKKLTVGLMTALMAASLGCSTTKARQYTDADVRENARQAKQDIDEEFCDRNEPGDDCGGETDTIQGGRQGGQETAEDEMRRGGVRLNTGMQNLKKEYDEELKDPNEPGDDYGTETKTMAPSGKTDHLNAGDEAKRKMDKAKEDIDEEFADPNEPGDSHGGETDTFEGGDR